MHFVNMFFCIAYQALTNNSSTAEFNQKSFATMCVVQSNMTNPLFRKHGIFPRIFRKTNSSRLFIVSYIYYPPQKTVHSAAGVQCEGPSPDDQRCKQQSGDQIREWFRARFGMSISADPNNKPATNPPKCAITSVPGASPNRTKSMMPPIMPPMMYLVASGNCR